MTLKRGDWLAKGTFNANWHDVMGQDPPGPGCWFSIEPYAGKCVA